MFFLTGTQFESEIYLTPYALEFKKLFENLYTIITRVAYAVPNDEISF